MRASPVASNPSRTVVVLIALVITALAGLSVFGVLAWRSVTVERLDSDPALRRFAAIRDQFGGWEPILRVDSAGKIERRPLPDNDPGTHATVLHALAYHVSDRRLVRAEVPFWFLKAKGPAVQYSLRGTGVDLKRLGLTPRELERYGPCVVLDEARANGDRLLVWTQ